MFLIRGRACRLGPTLHRRDVLQFGVGGAIAAGSGLLTSAASAAPREIQQSFGKAKSCIFIYLFGGPSHQDIWDLKPDAPQEIRGEFKPIATNAPGIQITEHLPLLARMADKYSIIRSLSHGDTAHGSSSHAMLTGRLPRVLGEVPPTSDDFPHYGSVLSQLRPSTRSVLPFVALPWTISTSTNLVPGQDGGFLGRVSDPLCLENPTDGSPIFAPPMARLPDEVTAERLQRRRQLLDRVDEQNWLGRTTVPGEMVDIYQRAFRFMDSTRAQEAFRLDREPTAVRERYGQNVFGQSLLLARRLVEAGVPMITVYWPDRKEPEAFNNNGVRDKVAVPPWDTHGANVGASANFPFLKDRLLPALDYSSTALLDDLQARGLLDETLVVWTGEFGRSPRVNGNAGRDHYGNVFSAMLAGGGVRGGQVYGSSDKHAAYPRENPASPADFAATLYHCLGVAPDAMLTTRLGQLVKITDGQPIAPLVS